MKLLALLILGAALTSVPLYAQSAPPQAAAVGFTNLVFDDEFSTADYTTQMQGSYLPGVKWYPFEWGWNAKLSTATWTSGTLTISGGGNLTTVPTYPSFGSTVPITTPGAFHHGYFEARFQFPAANPGQGGWPSFWSYGTSAFQSVSGTAWTSGYTAELDFFEAYAETAPNWSAIQSWHNWQHASNGVSGTDIGNNNGSNFMSGATPNDGAYHTLGCLWAATSPTTGYVQYYLDNKLVTHNTGLTQWATGVGTSFPQLELDNMFLILGSGNGWPINVSWVRVWGAPAVPTSGATLTITSGAATSTINLPSGSSMTIKQN